MSQNTTTFIAVEWPIFQVVILGIAGYFIRRYITANDVRVEQAAQRAHEDAIRVSQRAHEDNERRDSDLAEQSRALAVLVAAQAPLADRIGLIERRNQTLSEATTALAATLEAHEKWQHNTHPNERR